MNSSTIDMNQVNVSDIQQEEGQFGNGPPDGGAPIQDELDAAEGNLFAQEGNLFTQEVAAELDPD